MSLDYGRFGHTRITVAIDRTGASDDRDAPLTTAAEHLIAAQMYLEQKGDAEKGTVVRREYGSRTVSALVAAEHAAAASALAGESVLKGR